MSTQVFPPLNVVVPPKAPDVQNFISSGTWPKPDGAKWVFAELIGAGGGGAGSGIGGGGGQYFSILLNASQLGATESVTVGAGVYRATGGSSTFSFAVAVGGRNNGVGGGTTAADATLQLTNGGAGTAAAPGGSSKLGAGGAHGQTTGAVGLGGTIANAWGLLKAGDGATLFAVPNVPGGGSGQDAGARGQVRITTYF